MGLHMMPAIVGIIVFCGVVLAPAMVVSVCFGLNRMAGSGANVADLARRFVFALAPVGVAMWAAHLLFHFVTGWAALLPGWLASAQILLLDAGLLATLYVSWRVGQQSAGAVRTAVALVTPWVMLSCGLYAAGVWILFQPMQMRGMVH